MASIRKRQWLSKAGRKLSAWVVDYHDRFGHRKVKQFRSRTAANEWLEHTDLQASNSALKEKTIAEVGRAWLERGESEELERATLEQYRWGLKQIIPTLGHISIGLLTREDIVAFRKQHAAAKTPETSRRAVQMLKMILNYAVDSGWVARNVAWKLKSSPSLRHRIASRRTNLQIPSLSELRKALRACDRWTGNGLPRMRQRNRLCFLVLIETGMRPSELRGLAWHHIRIERLEIEISQRADQWGNIGPCKTASAYRTVPISPNLASELELWRKACPSSSQGLVFPTATGNPLAPRNLGREWWKVQLAAGVSRSEVGPDGKHHLVARYRLYDIRHFRASWWIYQRLDLKSLTTRLGHSSIQMTFDTYGHLVTDAEKEDVMATALEDVLYRESNSHVT